MPWSFLQTALLTLVYCLPLRSLSLLLSLTNRLKIMDRCPLV
jgi:hypothetical protein